MRSESCDMRVWSRSTDEKSASKYSTVASEGKKRKKARIKIRMYIYNRFTQVEVYATSTMLK